MPTKLKEAPTSDQTLDAQASHSTEARLVRPSRWVRFPFALVLFFALNFAVEQLMADHRRVLDEAAIQNSDSEARQQGPWAWWLSRAYLMRRKAPDIAIFGSSQIGAATFSADAANLRKDLDCVTHRNLSTLEMAIDKMSGHHLDTVNLGMGGAFISDAFMLSRSLFHEGQQPSMVIITINPRDFVDNDLAAPSATEPFKFLLPYVNLNGLEQAAYPDWLSRFDWFLNENFALKRKQKAAQTEVAKLVAHVLPASDKSDHLTISNAKSQDKKVFLQTISGSAGEVKPGEWVVPAVTPPDLWMDNTREYLHRYKNPDSPIFGCEKQFFIAMLNDLKQKHIPILIVQMPSLPMNRQLLPESFWKKYKNWIATTCKQYDADLCDLSDNPAFVKAHYLDTVHLNSRGGNMLFAFIAQSISQSPKLMAVVNAQGTDKQAQKDRDPDDVGASATVGTWH